MKKRVLKRFADYVRSEMLPLEKQQWYSIEKIEAMIVDNPHYKALTDIGLPDDHEKQTGRRTLKQEVQWHVIQTAQRIESRWIDQKIHECFGIKELEECILMEIGELEPPHSDALTFIQNYYQKLRASISSTLYYSKPIYDRNELEIMVPHVDSPFYSRKAIIDEYLQKKASSKPEGHREAIAAIDKGDGWNFL